MHMIAFLSSILDKNGPCGTIKLLNMLNTELLATIGLCAPFLRENVIDQVII